MKKTLLLLAALPLLASCNRVPTGILSLADGSEAAPRVVDSNANTRAERDLKRLSDIDKSIQASLTRLDAALDPNNTDPANLEKLVVGDGIDPALASNRQLRQQAEIDQKLDEKNQALIDNTRSGNLDEFEETGNPDGDTLSREQRLQTEIDDKLDDKAEAAVSEPAEEESTEPATEPADSSSPAPETSDKPSL
ncbi:MAG: hypothetical protein ACAI44_03465 [Candidatus Sericytochromatia bacterium]